MKPALPNQVVAELLHFRLELLHLVSCRSAVIFHQRKRQAKARRVWCRRRKALKRVVEHPFEGRHPCRAVAVVFAHNAFHRSVRQQLHAADSNAALSRLQLLANQKTRSLVFDVIELFAEHAPECADTRGVRQGFLPVRRRCSHVDHDSSECYFQIYIFKYIYWYARCAYI